MAAGTLKVITGILLLTEQRPTTLAFKATQNYFSHLTCHHSSLSLPPLPSPHTHLFSGPHDPPSFRTYVFLGLGLYSKRCLGLEAPAHLPPGCPINKIQPTLHGSSQGQPGHSQKQPLLGPSLLICITSPLTSIHTGQDQSLPPCPPGQEQSCTAYIPPGTKGCAWHGSATH